MKNTEDKLLPYSLSMKLKEIGYDEPCDASYVTAIRHKGEDLGCDEEYELRAEGKGDEHEKFNSRIEAAKHGIEYALDNYVRQINKDKE